MRQVDHDFSSFFKTLKSPKNKGKKVHIPKYKDKKKGRNVFVYTNQTAKLIDGNIQLKTKEGFIYIKVNVDNFQQVRIIPKGNFIVVEIVYNTNYDLKDDNKRYASIDLGINNICTLTSNVMQSILYSGRPLKAINQHWNKTRAKMQSNLPKNTYTSKRMSRLNYRRNNKVKDFMHKLSKDIVDVLVANNINTLFIGKNTGWKNQVNLGANTNQKFVCIPYNMLISMLDYKCKLVGINFIVLKESYTSKCSFLDNEEICKHKTYMGNRKHRGLFISNSGIRINADVNGSYNIMRLGLDQLNVKLDVLEIRPENQRFVLNPVSRFVA